MAHIYAQASSLLVLFESVEALRGTAAAFAPVALEGMRTWP